MAVSKVRFQGTGETHDIEDAGVRAEVQRVDEFVTELDDLGGSLQEAARTVIATQYVVVDEMPADPVAGLVYMVRE